MTVEEFKKSFVVGETILGYATNLKCTITAIGDERFLYKTEHSHKERVGTMDAYQPMWRKLEKEKK